MLSRLIKPKWKHKDPSIRRAAVHKIKDIEVLIELANNDSDLSVRKTAIFAIPNIPSLLLTTPHDGLDDFRTERFTELLFEPHEALSLTPELKALFTNAKDPRFFRRVALEFPSPEFRLAAIDYIDDDDLLADIILLDASAEVRALCASRIQTEAPIRSALKKLPKREKRTSKILRSKLEEIEKINAVIARKKSLLDKMESLGRNNQWQRDQTSLLSLANEWTQLPPHTIKHIDAEFEKSTESARERINLEKSEAAALEPVSEEKSGQCEFVESYLKQLTLKQRISNEEAIDVNSTLDLFLEEWRQLPPLAEREEAQLANRFHNGISDCRKRVSELQEMSKRTAHLEKILQCLRNALSNSKTDEGALEKLELEWSSQQLPGDTQLASEYRSTFQQLSQQLKTRLEKNQQKKSQGLQLIQHYIDSIETNLNQEKLGDSSELIKKAQATLAELPALHLQERREIEQRLKTFAPQIKTLEGWRHWGTDRAREELIEEAQSLDDLELPITERAERIKSLRHRWKELGAIDPAARKTLWRKFDEACSKAYEPCKQHYEEEAAGRDKNLEARRSICSSLNELASNTDWSSPKWRSIDKQFIELQNQWRRCGPVNRKDWAEILETYQQSSSKVEQQLHEERKNNLAFREGLIRKIEALQKEDDPRSATEQLKKLQKHWNLTVSSKRSQEQKLWKRFKAAGDAVYGKEKARRQEAADEQKQGLSGKEIICEAIEELSGEESSLIKRELERLEAEWEAQPMPEHRSARALQQRFSKAVANCLSDIQCAEVEAQRTELRQLLDTSKDDANVPREEHPADADDRLLDLEIQLNIDSPTQFQQRRMEKQVNRLSAKLGENKGSSSLDEIIHSFKALLQKGHAHSPSQQERIVEIHNAIDNEFITQIAEIKQGE